VVVAAKLGFRVVGGGRLPLAIEEVRGRSSTDDGWRAGLEGGGGLAEGRRGRWEVMEEEVAGRRSTTPTSRGRGGRRGCTLPLLRGRSRDRGCPFS
jgi:hypothetical protein